MTLPSPLPAVLAAGVLLTVTACGGSAGSSADPQPSATAAAGSGPTPTDRFPGAAGTIAAIDGRTLQVRSVQAGQVAVTYTAKTKFTKTVAARRADVRVGSCVDVRPAESSGKASSGAVTAAAVAISDPVAGSCQVRGFGGPAGGPGVFRGSGDGPPSGAPTARPSGAPGGRRLDTGFRPTVGRVTRVSGASFTVAALVLDGPAASPTATPSASPAAPSTRPVQVATGTATTYSTTAAGTARDLAVGQCVQAIGPTDDTGAVSADRISTQPAVDGHCAIDAVRRTTTGGR